MMLIILILMEVLFVLNIYHCVKHRKFYKECGSELTGTVLSGDQKQHILTVQTDEGIFQIESVRNFRKYPEGKEVRILIIQPVRFPELSAETLAELSPEALEALEKARSAESEMKASARQLTILKDDLQSKGEIIILSIGGIFFGILCVITILDRFL